MRWIKWIRDIWNRLFKKSEPTPIPKLFGEGDRCSIHEIGHTVSSWVCTAVSDIEGVILHEAGGLTTYHVRPFSKEEIAWYKIVIALSGLAAELKYLRKFRSGMSNEDLTVAWSIAELIASKRISVPWKIDLHEKFPPFEKFLNSAKYEEVAVLRIAYSKAVQIVNHHSHQFPELVEVLNQKKKIGQKDIELILGARYFTVFAVLGPSFVV